MEDLDLILLKEFCSRLIGDKNSPLLISVLEFYFPNITEEVTCKILGFILKFPTQYKMFRFFRTIPKVDKGFTLRNWSIKRLIKDLEFLFDRLNICRITGVSKSLKPTSFILRISKMGERLNSPVLVKTTTQDIIREKKMSSALERTSSSLKNAPESLREEKLEKIRVNISNIKNEVLNRAMSKKFIRDFRRGSYERDIEFSSFQAPIMKAAMLHVAEKIPTYKDMLLKYVSSCEDAYNKKPTSRRSRLSESVKAKKEVSIKYKCDKHLTPDFFTKSRYKKAKYNMNIERDARMVLSNRFEPLANLRIKEPIDLNNLFLGAVHKIKVIDKFAVSKKIKKIENLIKVKYEDIRSIEYCLNNRLLGKNAQELEEEERIKREASAAKAKRDEIKAKRAEKKKKVEEYRLFKEDLEEWGALRLRLFTGNSTDSERKRLKELDMNERIQKILENCDNFHKEKFKEKIKVLEDLLAKETSKSKMKSIRREIGVVSDLERKRVLKYKSGNFDVIKNNYVPRIYLE